MIKVNGSDYPWVEELTVSALLAEKGYTFSRIIVRVNGQLIHEEEYETAMVRDGDDVQVLHIFGGG